MTGMFRFPLNNPALLDASNDASVECGALPGDRNVSMYAEKKSLVTEAYHSAAAITLMASAAKSKVSIHNDYSRIPTHSALLLLLLWAGGRCRILIVGLPFHQAPHLIRKKERPIVVKYHTVPLNLGNKGKTNA